MENAAKKLDSLGAERSIGIDWAQSLRQVLDLPEAQWFAVCAPLSAFQTDPQFLNFLKPAEGSSEGADGGYLRPAEIKSALRWFLQVFEKWDGEATGGVSLKLSRIRKDDEEGKRILEAAEEVLQFEGKSSSARVDLSAVRRVRKQMESEGGLHRGRVAEFADCSVSCRQLIGDILRCAGDESVSAGERGRFVSEADLREFMRQVKELSDWEDELPKETESDTPPFGKESKARHRLYSELFDRIESFFALCRLAKVNPKVKAMLANPNPPPSSIDWGSREEIESLARQSPIAAVNSELALKFNGPFNPLDARKLLDFREQIVAPIFGEPFKTLKEEQWEAIKQRFSRYDSWMRRAPQTAAARVEPQRRRAYLTPDSAAVELNRLFQKNRENATRFKNLLRLEKAILFQAHLPILANHFANGSDWDSPMKRAVFEMGTLIFDGREFRFCVRVADRERHLRHCRGENLFVIYAEIQDGEGAAQCEIAAPATSGERGRLCVGQRGLFQDTQGREFSARIVQILECPVNFWEGMASIFKWTRMPLVGVQKTQETQSEISGELRAKDALAGGGRLVWAAIVAAGAFLLQTLSEANLWRLFWAAAASSVIVLATSAAATALRLRQRDLRCLLEGGGWGINSKMRITPKTARALTRRRRE